jgi:hypothetical protein
MISYGTSRKFGLQRHHHRLPATPPRPGPPIPVTLPAVQLGAAAASRSWARLSCSRQAAPSRWPLLLLSAARLPRLAAVALTPGRARRFRRLSLHRGVRVNRTRLATHPRRPSSA